MCGKCAVNVRRMCGECAAIVGRLDGDRGQNIHMRCTRLLALCVCAVAGDTPSRLHAKVSGVLVVVGGAAALRAVHALMNSETELALICVGKQKRRHTAHEPASKCSEPGAGVVVQETAKQQ